MTRTLDPDLLDLVVRRDLGQHAILRRHDRTPTTPMNLVLDVAERSLDCPFALYWAENTSPLPVSLPDLTPGVIVFTPRYVEMAGSIRNLLDAGYPDESRERHVYLLCLRFMADLAVDSGDVRLAADLLATCALDAAPGERLPVFDLMSLERVPKDEAYCCIWFFALAHEVGHVYSAHRPAGSSPADDRVKRRLLQRIERTAAERRDAGMDELRPLVKDGDGYRGALATDVLLTELDADLFAVRVMYGSVKEIMRRDGGPYRMSPDRLALEILYSFTIMQVLTWMGRFVDLTTRHLDVETYDLHKDIASDVRLDLVMGQLAEIIHLLDPREVSAGAGREVLHERFDAAVPHRDLDRGLSRALERVVELTSATRPTAVVELWGRNDLRGSPMAHDVESFVAGAWPRRPFDPSLELLALAFGAEPPERRPPLPA